MNPVLQRIESSSLARPPRIRFGEGATEDLPAVLADLGRPRRILIVIAGGSVRTSGLLDRVARLVASSASQCDAVSTGPGEPVSAHINAAAEEARTLRPDAVIGLGGGSAMDAAKAVAALAANPGPVEDYLEGVGTGRTLERDPLPCIGIPTTAGTGAEATRNAVIGDPQRGYKKSMRDGRMIPAAAVLDPLLTHAVPPETTAAGGMDAITQLIESCISRKRKPEVTEVACAALPGMADALRRCVRHGADGPARATLMLGSFASGVCLANAGLALAHGVASGMGALTRIPHGLICGVLLPHTLRYNREHCREELSQALAAFLGEPEMRGDTMDRGIAAIERLGKEIGIPADFRHLQLGAQLVERIAENSMGSSMSGNPANMTPQSTLEFLRPIFLE